MPDQIVVNFKNFQSVEYVAWNLLRLGKIKKMPSGTPPSSFEESLIRTGVQSAAYVSPRIKRMSSWLSPPLPSMSVIGSVPGIKIRSSRDFTVPIGLVASVADVVAAGLGGGIYFWNKKPKGEFGLFGTISVGFITNIGASAGYAMAFLFDQAPIVLAGDIISLEVDVEITPPLTISGQIFFAPPPFSWPPAPFTFLTWPIGGWIPEIVGVGFQLTAGISVLPISIGVVPSRTWIKPLFP